MKRGRDMLDEINHDRRRLLGNAALAFAAVPLGISSLQFDQKRFVIKPDATPASVH